MFEDPTTLFAVKSSALNLDKNIFFFFWFCSKKGEGATTISITTFSITTLSIVDFFETDRRYAECRPFIVMLSGVMLNVIMLSVVA
jgi:hypothetical protein